MPTPELVVATLRARGELWEAVPGAVGLRGAARGTSDMIERAIARLARELAPDEWRMPAALSFATLERAGYFASFPQWLTCASHLRDEAGALERLAASPTAAHDVPHACAPAGAALPPAVCYHAWAALADRVLAAPVLLTAQGTCWRHEGDATAPLARGWAFTMREAVCVGDAHDVAAFRDRGIARARSLAAALSLDAGLEEATDPFFRPTARGREVLQRLKGLKQELRLAVGDDTVAAASFNLHEGFFGEAFDIRLRDGSPAASGCVAYGIERWLLAFLAAHGTSARDWPVLPSIRLQEAAA
jgi:seryl-tRNA synthetase